MGGEWDKVRGARGKIEKIGNGGDRDDVPGPSETPGKCMSRRN